MNIEPIQALSPKMRIACAIYASTFSVNGAEREAHLRPGAFREQLAAPVVQREIQKHIDRITRQSDVSAAELLNHLSDMVHADIADIYDQYGNFKPLHAWPEIWRKMVIGMECYPSGVPMKVKFMDRTKIIELVGKHVQVGAFSETTRHIHDIGDRLASRLENARNRSGVTLEHDPQ